MVAWRESLAEEIIRQKEIKEAVRDGHVDRKLGKELPESEAVKRAIGVVEG